MTHSHLFIDIGNTAIDFLLDLDRKTLTYKVGWENEDGIRKILEEIIRKKDRLDSCLISSVNSKALLSLAEKLDFYSISYEVLNPDLMKEYAEKNGYTVTNTSYLGSDLFCDIISRESKEGLIVIDLGTAGKVLFLDKDKVFHGCNIFPGVLQFPKILNISTDLLKDSLVKDNPPVVSLKTDECISSGAIYGTAGIIERTVKEIINHYHCPNAKIILTGGNARYVKDILRNDNQFQFETDSNVVLEGLARCIGITDVEYLKEEF